MTTKAVPTECAKKRKLQSEDVSFVYIEADQLLVMSSAELASRVDYLTCIRSLTPAELKEVCFRLLLQESI